MVRHDCYVDTYRNDVALKCLCNIVSILAPVVWSLDQKSYARQNAHVDSYVHGGHVHCVLCERSQAGTRVLAASESTAPSEGVMLRTTARKGDAATPATNRAYSMCMSFTSFAVITSTIDSHSHNSHSVSQCLITSSVIHHHHA